MGENMSSLMTQRLELCCWFEIVSDGHGFRGPVRESVRSAAVAEGHGEAFGFDKCTDFLEETFGCGTGEESWCDRVKIVA